MGILFIDSFDHYTDLAKKGWVNYNCSISAGNGRFSTDAAYCGGTEPYIGRHFTSQLSTFYVGMGLKTVSPRTGKMILFQSSIGIDTSFQCSVILETDGTIGGNRGYYYAYNDLGHTSPGVWTDGVWHHIEAMFTISATVGEILVNLDGVEVLHITGANTAYTPATPYATTLYLNRHGGYSYQYYADDFWLANDSLKGDCRVQYIKPTGAGNYSQWTPTSSVNNYECVDEDPPSTTDYVSEGTAGQIDTYVVENLTPTTGTVHAVAGNFYCQKNDAGSRQIAIATRLSSTDDAGSGISVPSDWSFIQDIKATKPGGGAWTISDVNSAEMGQKMIS